MAARPLDDAVVMSIASGYKIFNYFLEQTEIAGFGTDGVELTPKGFVEITAIYGTDRVKHTRKLIRTGIDDNSTIHILSMFIHGVEFYSSAPKEHWNYIGIPLED